LWLRAHDPLLGHPRADERVLAARVQPGAVAGERALRSVRRIELAVDADAQIGGKIVGVAGQIADIGIAGAIPGIDISGGDKADIGVARDVLDVGRRGGDRH